MQVLKAAFCSLIYELNASFLASMACTSVDQGIFSYKKCAFGQHFHADVTLKQNAFSFYFYSFLHNLNPINNKENIYKMYQYEMD
jgi:hypothetical protein